MTLKSNYMEMKFVGMKSEMGYGMDEMEALPLFVTK